MLIVEDEPLIAMCLASAVEDFDGVVVGPTATVAGAMEIIETIEVAGAILDCNLADREITPVALLLWERGIPFVLHSAKGIPAELARKVPGLLMVPKPAEAAEVVKQLWNRCHAGR